MSSALGVGRLAAQGCERALATASRRPPSGTGIASATGLRGAGRSASATDAAGMLCCTQCCVASPHVMSHWPETCLGSASRAPMRRAEGS